jgi:hypothetical protein
MHVDIAEPMESRRRTQKKFLGDGAITARLIVAYRFFGRSLIIWS